MPDGNQELEKYREHLCLLGQLQVNDKFAGKVDVSGVVQITLLEAYQQGWSELLEDEQVLWLRRLFAINLLDETLRRIVALKVILPGRPRVFFPALLPQPCETRTLK